MLININFSNKRRYEKMIDSDIVQKKKTHSYTSRWTSDYWLVVVVWLPFAHTNKLLADINYKCDKSLIETKVYFSSGDNFFLKTDNK